MSSNHRKRFLDRINGRRTVPGVLFFPDITDWYASRRTPPGAPRPFLFGVRDASYEWLFAVGGLSEPERRET